MPSNHKYMITIKTRFILHLLSLTRKNVLLNFYKLRQSNSNNLQRLPQKKYNIKYSYAHFLFAQTQKFDLRASKKMNELIMPNIILSKN